MIRYDLPNYLTVLSIAPVADVTTTANGTPFDLAPYEGKILVRLDAGNASAGTNPTLDFVFKESSDNSNWSNANVAFTQVTATSRQVIAYDPRAHLRYFRIDRTIGGTNSPSFPVGIAAYAQRQYNPG